MGYCSDVTIYIVEKEDLSIKQMIKGADIVEIMGQDCYETGINSEGKNILKVTYDYVKWYDGYAIVEYWKKVLNSLNPGDYLFTRVGEDNGDVEIDGEYGSAYEVTTLEYDVDFKQPCFIENNKNIVCYA